MYRERKIGLVIPAYKEERLLPKVLASIPDLIDYVVVVDDASPDDQAEVVRKCAQTDPRVHLVQHAKNSGPGQAVISGYLEAADNDCDVIVVVGGDNQMDLNEVERFLDPIIDGVADYTKGNRFLLSTLDDTLQKMPRLRLVGNILIAAVAKIASGYYKTMDFVDGYTAISRESVRLINWNRAWKEYGYPIDFLIRLNAYSLVSLDIPRTAIYTPGERQSQIKGLRYFIRVAPMIFRGFLWRLKFKYLYRDFHPLVLFYLLAGLLLPTGTLLGGFMVVSKVFLDGSAITAARSIGAGVLILAGIQFLLFAMFFDMEQSQWQARERATKPNPSALPCSKKSHA
jgi:glycosyltransferase involved in cell wall biosynthesis